MGLFSSVKKLAKKAIKRARPALRPVGTAILGAGAFEAVEQIAFGGRTRALPTTGRLPPGISGVTRGLPSLPGVGAPGFTRALPRDPITGMPLTPGGVGCPQGFHFAKDGSGRCVRNRRMNVMNPRAARRAIRRIKGARKMLMSIERQLPRQRVTRRVPGHRARLTHD